MPLMRLILASAAVTLPLLASGPAIAFCSRPISPSCASDGKLSGRYIAQSECRRQVEDHLDDLIDYRLCRLGEIEQVNRDIERIRGVLEPDAQRP